jgi:GNAT superfamily N-acetyltransferase
MQARETLVITRCDDPRSIPAPAPGGGIELQSLDLQDPTTLEAWLDTHAAAFGVRWTGDEFRRAFDEHPVIDVLWTRGPFDRTGALVGAASAGLYRRAPHVGLSHYIFVRPDGRGHHIGQTLIRDCYTSLARRGVEALECQTHVHRHASLRMHFAHGFHPKYRFEHFNSIDRASRFGRWRANRQLRAVYSDWLQHPDRGERGG